MKLRSKLCVLLLALLLVPASSGCRLIVPSDKPVSAPTFDGWRYGNPDDYNEDPYATVSDAPASGGVQPVSGAEWEVDWALDIDFPRVPEGGLEMPVAGATGFSPVELYLWQELPATNACKVASSPSKQTAAVADTLYPGTAFMILQESGEWWQVRTETRGGSGGKVGWVESCYCFINLPDVIPSMIYNDTNSDSSVFRASGKDIPMITSKPLYKASAMRDNARLGRQEYMMPVLYPMAKKICQAQQNALAEGNTIVLYEGYRPYETQMAVVRGVQSLAAVDSEVRAGISTSPWSISWFIATGISNHQQGYAMDVSLAKVSKSHIETIDGYSFVQVDEYEEYSMPTPIHELSKAACTFTAPVTIMSRTAWQSGELSAAMAANRPARGLQRYCTSAQMTPLASEWWHFNDLDAYDGSRYRRSIGNFDISDCKCMSLTPSLVEG